MTGQGVPKGWEAGVELGVDQGTVTSGPVEAPITDWGDILKLWNLDPEHFEVVEPAQFKAWDGFAKEEDEDGTSRAVSKRLFSYKATIRRRSPHQIKPETFAEWRKSLLKAKPLRPRAPKKEKISYVTLIADPQLGKEGTEEAVANWRRGVEGHANRITRLVDDGYDVEWVAAFMGDEVENVVNNYGNQPHTVELNLSEQLLLDFDMTMWTLKTLASTGASARRVTSVRSNHGEWTRNGDKEPVTANRDNSSTFIRLTAQRALRELPGWEDVRWEVATHGPHVCTDLSGVKVYFSHFYEQKGRGGSTEVKTRTAIERQIIGRTEELGDCRIYFTAHFHHFYCQEWEGRTQFGCPALEAEKSSGYMLNQYGVWSRPGMLGVIVGRGVSAHGWTEPVIF